MLSSADTAYPLLKADPSARELDELFTPNLFELTFAESQTRQPTLCLGLLLLLKTFQRLGYFVQIGDIPLCIVQHISRAAGFPEIPEGLYTYDSGSARGQHMTLVRSYLGVKAFDRAANKVMVKACVEASRVREDLADIINVGIEELIRQRYQLPGFTTLFRAARTARATVNRGYYRHIAGSLDEATKSRLAPLFEPKPEERSSGWEAVKREPGRPTVQHIRQFVRHLDWLRQLAGSGNPLVGVPPVKIQRFAAEARALNVSRMKELMEPKRWALTAGLVHRQLARAFDDGADMFIRVVQKMHNKAKDLLKEQQASYLAQSSELITTLRDVTLAYRQEGTAEERLQAIGELLSDPDAIVSRCEEQAALVSGDHHQFLPRSFRHPRKALLLLLQNLPMASTTQDKSLEQAIAFVTAHKASAAENLSVLLDQKKDGAVQTASALDLSFVPDHWWPLVTGLKNRTRLPAHVSRRFLELCVVSQVANELKSGDLCLPSGDKFRDYRQQLVPWDIYEQEVAGYGERTGIPVTGKEFVEDLRRQLEAVARKTDQEFPQNEYLRIENSEPVLSPMRGRADPEGLKAFESRLKERMEQIEILDALVDTEHWLNWTRFFGPLSGHEAKLDRPRERYVVTAFCYGCDLGPTQTARSLRGLDRFKLAFINQRHITEANLNDAITEVINKYIQFPLQRCWGLGRTASADGMKWDLYPQNLMAEYHIRYGGYGGIGYYLLSDSYIALMSRFTSCGSWEGHYILDFLQENQSEVHPDTVHADTQGQSEAIFGLAYLLGIQLQPRIRDWKGLEFYRAGKESRYEHIDSLFTAQANMELIESMLPDMLRVAVSIYRGAILPSDILRRLGSYSRKNKLYFAFRELGRVVRTIFLLRYIADAELRQTIHAATTKSERFNQFVQWVAFGGNSVIAENVRDEQRKFIKYNHLVANLLVFHNVVNMTKAIERWEAEGHTVSDEILAVLSPYQTEHINRFGTYVLNFDRVPAPLPAVLTKPQPEEKNRNAALVRRAAIGNSVA
jgi:TnpA family transposase